MEEHIVVSMNLIPCINKAYACMYVCINVDDVKMNQTNHSKALGLNIDENLFWKEHIQAISKKVASSIGPLKRVRSFISMHTDIYKGLIEPHFADYCSVVWDGLSRQVSDKNSKTTKSCCQSNH